MKYKLTGSVGIIDSKLPISIKDKHTVRVELEGMTDGCIIIDGKRRFPVVDGCASIPTDQLRPGDHAVSFIDGSGRHYVGESIHVPAMGHTLDRGGMDAQFIESLCGYCAALEANTVLLEKRIAALEAAVYPSENLLL